MSPSESGEEAPVEPGRDERLRALEEALGHRFRNRGLLETALRHSSSAHEVPGTESNERLEFLGDAVVGLVAAHRLFAAHPAWREGELTRALHALVDKPSLAQQARALGVGACLELGRTERRGGGEEKDTILADAMEALLAALYLDAGLGAVDAFCRRAFRESLEGGVAPAARDPKTALQESVMAVRGEFPSYAVLADSGREGDPERFRVAVRVQGEVWAEGVGRSKRAAQRAAAEAALERARSEEEVRAGAEADTDG